MKNCLLFTFLFFFVCQLNAQDNNQVAISVDNISKKWIFSDLINPKFTKKEYEETKEMLVDTSIEFRKDMTFTFSFIVDLEGTWSLNNTIISTEDRRGKGTWKIYKISNTELVMSKNEAEQKIVFKLQE
jgi:hypothetical protein